ncbi:MAG: DUF1207 domain-containing protein [Ignavibacteriales bacterium]|nr:DUF1207 domain-containing protein [Ignavibacteriales bacterium]
MNRFFPYTTILIVAAVSFLSASESQSPDRGWSFVASGNLFHALRANTFEPRVGIRELTDHSSLRLDIGNSLDILRFAPDAGPVFACGVDFFTFTKLRSEENFHFPVDAVDYLFGFNTSMKDTLRQGLFSARLRLSHVSAHMVDGHYDNFEHLWKDGRNPIVYSREFIDMVAAFEPAAFCGALRFYAGGMYIYHIDPSSLGRAWWYGGVEYRHSIANSVSVYAAYQPSLLNINGWSVRHEVEAGLHLGIPDGRGVNVFWTYFSGKSIHGEYNDVVETSGALGIRFEL